MITNPENVAVPVGNCLAVPRIWEMALRPTCWPADVSEHLLNCLRCQANLTRAIAAVQKRESAERKFAAALLLLSASARCRAHRPFALPRPADRFDTGLSVEDATAVVFDFEDPDLKATVSLLEDGGSLLRIEHRALHPGDLVLALVRTPGGSVVWARFVMLRRGYRHAIGHVRLMGEGLEGPCHQFFIDPVTALPTESADLLRESFFQACLDAPEAVETWRSWARKQLEECPYDPAVWSVLEAVRDTVPQRGG